MSSRIAITRLKRAGCCITIETGKTTTEALTGSIDRGIVSLPQR